MVLTFCCNFADENAAKAGKLGVMEALLEALSFHEANVPVIQIVSGAIRDISENGANFFFLFLVNK